MSGAAGGNRIQKVNVQATFDKYVKEVLQKIPGFQKAGLSGSVKVGVKADYGDLDLITLFEGDDKKEVKQRIIKLINSLPDSVIVPFKSEKYKGRRYYNSGEIITVLYPIVGKEGEFIQIDNIISLTEAEHDFKGGFLDLPAEKQGLILGLVKTALLEEKPSIVFKRLNISNIPPLGENEEYEFNLSSNKLTLRKVKLDNFREVSREEIWSSTNWNDIQTLLANFDLEQSFVDLLDGIVEKLKNPRSRNRIKGIFKSMISVKSGEVGTEKGANKEKAISQVDSLLEQDHNQEGVVALYGGGFKPPHLAHFENAKILASKADKLIIFIGKKIRDGVSITPEQSKHIWETYAKYLGVPVEVIISPMSPIRDTYEYAEQYQDTVDQIITGTTKAEMGRFKAFQDKQKYYNVTVMVLPEVEGEDTKFSATTIRNSQEYLKSGKWIPNEVSKEDKKTIIDTLSKQNMEKQIKEAIDKSFDSIDFNLKNTLQERIQWAKTYHKESYSKYENKSTNHQQKTFDFSKLLDLAKQAGKLDKNWTPPYKW